VGPRWRGLRTPRGVTKGIHSLIDMERSAVERKSRVGEMGTPPWTGVPSTTGHEEPCGNPGGPSPKAKYYLTTDSELVP
jgi:hypothetical protein